MNKYIFYTIDCDKHLSYIYKRCQYDWYGHKSSDRKNESTVS